MTVRLLSKQRGHTIAVVVMLLTMVLSQGHATAEVPTSQGVDKVAQGSQRVAINVAPQQVAYKINPLFFGSNILYWIEDDQAMQDGKIAGYLKDLQMRLLRFPGGTVADNYHWETNTLHNPNDFPYVPHTDAPGKMDTDEFIALCREVGAEPLLVVNTASWVRAGDIQGGAKEAAAWVEYTNKKNNYNVKYWAIGNETYHHILMSAEQYAKVVVEYARAMKAVDPTIKIGVNGHWDYTDVGTRERVQPGKLEMLLEAEATHNDKASKDAFDQLKEANVETNRHNGQPMWWPTVLSIAGNALDFAIIHWYFPFNYVGPRLETAVQNLNTIIKAMLPDREIPIALTEWNLAPNSIKGMSELSISLAIAEACLRFIDGGVSMGSFWPLRIGGSNNRSILGVTDREPRPVYHVFQAISTTIGDYRVPISQDDKDIYTFASVNEDRSELTVYVINRKGVDGKQVVVNTGEFKAATVTGQVFTSSTAAKPQIASVQVIAMDNGWMADLPPNSLAILRFTSGNEG